MKQKMKIKVLLVLISSSILLALQLPGQNEPSKASDGVKSPEISGDWMGSLDAGPIKLRVVFHIVNSSSGLTATMDSPDQGAKGIPVSTVAQSGSSVILEANNINGKFEGKLDDGHNKLEGTWSQGGAMLSLVLERVKDASEMSVKEQKRPQNPVKPYPYVEEEVSYENKLADSKLAGTLTRPTGKGPFPAILLIAGSGPKNRNEFIYGHSPFLVLADFLTRNGFAVLRYDKRGIGKSGGKYAAATSEDFADDAEAGVAYLKTRPEIDIHKIGLVGHSEGGLIAPIVAARNPDVRFIVLMAGPGVPGAQLLPEQYRMVAAAAGKNQKQIEEDFANNSELIALITREKDNAVVKKIACEKFAGKLAEPEVSKFVNEMTGPWMRRFLEYDPAPTLQKVHCPVLVIIGEKDLQVLPKQNLPAIRKALEDGGNKDFEVVEIPGLNHLFQSAKTGGVAEYGVIEETIAPVALEKITSWVLKHSSSN